MKKGKELLNNTIIIAIGNFSTKILSFFLLPIYTSILSTTDYGMYDLLHAVGCFIIPLITLLMEESMFRFLIDCKNNKEKSEVISQTFLYSFFSTLIFTAIYFVIVRIINIPYEFVFYLYILSNIILALKNALVRGTGRIKLYAASNFITSFIVIALNILFVVILKLGILSLLLSFVIGNALVSIVIFVKMKIWSYVSLRKYNKTKMKQMIKYSIPLVPNSLSWTIINLSDRIVISSFLGTSANGIYSMSNKFPSLMDMIYGFFYTAWKESAAKSLKDDDSSKFYISVYKALTKFLWAIVIMMIAAMPFVFNLIIKKAFVQSYLYIPILALAMYFSNIAGFYGGIFSAYKDTKIMGTTTVLAALINLIVNMVLIKFIGIWAAAISTLIATLANYLYRKVKLKKYIVLEENKDIFQLISIVIAFYSYYSQNLLVQIVSLILLSIYCILLNKNTILILYKSIFKKKVSSAK